MDNISFCDYLKEGMKIHYLDKEIEKYTKEEINEIIKKESDEIIENVFDHEFVTNKGYLIEAYETLYKVIFVDNNKVLDISELRDKFETLYPNFKIFNDDLVRQYIKVGYKYLFFPCGANDVSEEEIKEDKGKYEVMYISSNGLSSDGGFLDMYDTLYDCIFFDKNDERVDISPLRNAYQKCWEKNKELNN